jgi:hypothetical protein
MKSKVYNSLTYSFMNETVSEWKYLQECTTIQQKLMLYVRVCVQIHSQHSSEHLHWYGQNPISLL